MKKILVLLFLVLLCVPSVRADDASAAKLSAEIDNFVGQQNADGYLVWLFSGDPKDYLENDQYSFYQGSPMCTTLKQKAAQYPGKFFGVNIHSLATHPSAIIENNLAYLAKECGTTVIRIWGSPDRGGPPAAKQVLDIAAKHGIKVIVVIADYSNSSGDILPGSIRSNPTSWYTTDYRSKYLPYATSLAQTLKGNPGLFGYELANEPHCSGIAACVGPYNLWANDVANAIKRVDSGARVGIGQKASENTTLGDSPGPRQFFNSNNTGSIDFASAHYYTDGERDLATAARSQAIELSKQFYIGEAGFVTNELPSGTTSTTQAKGPLESNFSVLQYNCQQTTEGNPEYHPLRPYPGSPCDPLIPRSILEAPLDPDLKYNTFACGTALTPQNQQVFDPYGDNSRYENPALTPDIAGFAHTICNPRTPDEIARGGTVTCYRTSNFNVTVDLSHANLGILGNTQDPTLTDAQKVNEYLSWYLTGTTQISDQLPLDANNPKDMDRLVNYSGPLRKLMPLDLTQAAKLTLANSNGQNKVGQAVATVVDVSNAITTAAGTIFGNDKAVIDALTLIVENGFGSTLTKTFAILSKDVTKIPDALAVVNAEIPSMFGQFITVFSVVPRYGLNNLATALQAGQQIKQTLTAPNTGEVHNYIVGCESTNVVSYSQNIASAVGTAANGYFKNNLEAEQEIAKMIIDGVTPDDAFKIVGKWGLTNLSDFILIWQAGQQAQKVELVKIAKCSDANLARLRLNAYDSFDRALLKALPAGQIIDNLVLERLLTNVPFSSMEDTTGEVVLSVFKDSTNGQQEPNLVGSQSLNGRKTAPIQLIIKSATQAQPTAK